MDRQRHRLLTENVSYFQKCLTVTRELLRMCVDEGVLREEEEQTIWDEESVFGKSLELVYFLRKKDDVIYDKFVEILKQKRGSKDRLVDTMSKKRIEIDLWSSGQKTEMYLDKALSGMVKREIITRLAADMDQKMHQKERELSELAEIQKNNAKMINKKYKDQEETLRNIRKELEETVKKCEEHKEKEKALGKQFDILEERTQQLTEELQEHAQLNHDYVKHINLITEKYVVADGKSKYDEDIDIAEKNVERLKQGMEKATKELEETHAELNTLKEKIGNIRELVLPHKENATIDEIEEEIRKNTEWSKEKLDQFKELEKLKKTKAALEENIQFLRRDQRLIEFELRNEQAKTTRMTGRRKIESLYFAAATPDKRHQIVSAISLPQGFRQSLEKGRDLKDSLAVPMSTARAKTPKNRPKTPAKVYCVLCRNTVAVSNPGPCFIHKFGLSEGMWSCCSRRRDGKGCYSATHCYFAVDNESKDTISTIDRAQSIAFHEYT